jgi:hypothetical protein
MPMKALDFVRTPKGAIALVTETNRRGTSACIAYLGGGNSTDEKNAWWSEGEGLVVVDSLPRLLSSATAHPFGDGKRDVRHFFALHRDVEYPEDGT